MLFFCSFGSFLAGTGLVFMGPPPMVSYGPKNSTTMWIGQIISIIVNATGAGIGVIPTLPALKNAIPPEDREYKDDDIIGSVEAMIFGIGCIIGPVLGGILDQFYGFGITAASFGLAMISFSIGCFFFSLVTGRKQQGLTGGQTTSKDRLLSDDVPAYVALEE